MDDRIGRSAMNNNLPMIACDFNAAGWSGEADDTCYYAFDGATFDALEKVVGMRVFVFMYENVYQSEIVGCEVILEQYKDGWRARPDETTWYQGTIPGNTVL